MRGRGRRGRVLPPSGGPTQVGTTPNLAFRAIIEPHGESVMEVALWPYRSDAVGGRVAFTPDVRHSSGRIFMHAAHMLYWSYGSLGAAKPCFTYIGTEL